MGFGTAQIATQLGFQKSRNIFILYMGLCSNSVEVASESSSSARELHETVNMTLIFK